MNGRKLINNGNIRVTVKKTELAPSLQTQAEALVALTWNQESDIFADDLKIEQTKVLSCFILMMARE